LTRHTGDVLPSHRSRGIADALDELAVALEPWRTRFARGGYRVEAPSRDLAHQLGVEALAELGGAHRVAEDDRDGLADLRLWGAESRVPQTKQKFAPSAFS
jgi:hypothetical protein